MPEQNRNSTTERKSKRSRTDFTQLPNQVMRDPRLTQSDKVVYWVLKSHAWNGKSESFPSARRIADECGVSPRHVSKRTRTLERCGYIRVKRRLGEVNHYHFPSTLPPLDETVALPQNDEEYHRDGEGYPTKGEGYHQKVRTKHTKRNILTKTDEENHIHKNHTKYDSYAGFLETLPNGTDPNEGSVCSSILFTEEGKPSTTLQDTAGVAPSVLSGGDTGVGKTGHSAQVESVQGRSIPDWLETGLDHMLSRTDPIRARAIEHFTDRFRVMQMNFLSPNARRDALEGFVEMEIRELEQQQRKSALRNASVDSDQQSKGGTYHERL